MFIVGPRLGPSSPTDGAPQMSLATAQAIYGELAPVAEQMGFMLAMFGSVLKFGVGNDLDLLAVGSQNTAASADELVGAFSARGCFVEVHAGSDYREAAYVLREHNRSNGGLVHLQVRRF